MTNIKKYLTRVKARTRAKVTAVQRWRRAKVSLVHCWHLPTLITSFYTLTIMTSLIYFELFYLLKIFNLDFLKLQRFYKTNGLVELSTFIVTNVFIKIQKQKCGCWNDTISFQWIYRTESEKLLVNILKQKTENDIPINDQINYSI